MADVAVPRADASTALKRAQQGKSYWLRVWERLREDKVTLTVMGVLVMLLVIVVFAPWFATHDPYSGSVLRRLKPVGTPGHWLGTDEVGRDLWSRMVHGGRLSLLAGVVPVFLALLVGGFLGILAGYVGGLLNSAVMRLTDVLYAFPDVCEAAVVGAPDSYRGETVIAFVSPKPDAMIDVGALSRFCRERLAAYKCPVEIRVVDELPKTATGKITRNMLREYARGR